jgi:hypothetical protein
MEEMRHELGTIRKEAKHLRVRRKHHSEAHKRTHWEMGRCEERRKWEH